MHKTWIALVAIALTVAATIVGPSSAASTATGITSHAVTCYTKTANSAVTFRAATRGQYRFRWVWYSGSTRYLSSWNYYVPSLNAYQSAAKTHYFSHGGIRITQVIAVVIFEVAGVAQYQWSSTKTC